MLLASPAQAGLIVVSANDYAVGTDVSQLFPGLSMAQVTQGSGSSSVYDPVFAPVVIGDQYAAAADLGLQTMGSSGLLGEWLHCHESGGYSCGSGWSVVALNFASPADFVQINAAWLSDGPGMVAYDAAGNELANR